jgi:hypothetical protein
MEPTAMLHPLAAGHPAAGMGHRSGSDGCVRHRDAAHGVSATEAAPLADWLARVQAGGNAERRAIGACSLVAHSCARKQASQGRRTCERSRTTGLGAREPLALRSRRCSGADAPRAVRARACLPSPQRRCSASAGARGARARRTRRGQLVNRSRRA